MPTLCTSAVVLRTYPFSEADQVLVLFTREGGKLRALAKGSRRSHSRLAACMGWLSFSELQLFTKQGRELFLITQGQLQNAFPRVKTDLIALAQAARMVELVDALTPERQPLPEVFELLHQALQLMEDEVLVATVGIWFEISLLDCLGYQPQVQWCQLCKRSEMKLAYFAESGGVICRRCRPSGGIEIDPALQHLFEKFQHFTAGQVPQIHLSAGQQRTFKALLETAVHYQLGHKLKSDVFRLAIEKLKA